MKPLAPPSTYHARAAQGWFELGNHFEATAELNAIPTPLRAHPDVLEVRLNIYAKEAKWEQCAHIAEALVVLAPERLCGWIHLSHALHELKRTGAALQALLPAVDRFPNAAIIRYNLACYACQQGNLEAARCWLKKSFQIGNAKKLKLKALTESDLKPLLAEIGKLLPHRVTQARSTPSRLSRRIPSAF